MGESNSMFFAKLHPLLVHFPVGLLISGTLLEIYGKIQNDETALAAGKFNTRLGFWCALAAVIVGTLGLLELDVKQKSPLGRHILFALTTVSCLAVAFAANRFWKHRGGAAIYHALLLASLLAILGTGYYGGTLVHQFGIATLHAGEKNTSK
jgi:uncharacterized membrane protein